MKDFGDELEKELIRQSIRYFVEPAISTIAKRTKEFAKEISKKGVPVENGGLPSASIIGIGRCGTNIALLVAGLLSKSTLILNAANISTDSSNTSDIFRSITQWYRAWRSQKELPGSTVNPVILIGDFDKETFARLSRENTEALQNLPDYKRCRLLTQLQDYQIGGAGNIPLVGQYMGQAALATPVDESDLIQSTDADAKNKRAWALNRNYFIDSPGTEYNASRLFIYVFSSGGGTGSGMTPELGLAQQYALHSKYQHAELDENVAKSNVTTGGKRKEPKFESICSIGVAVLPDKGELATKDAAASNATFINTGRLLTRFLAHQQRYQEGFRGGREIETLRPFNALMLVSNETMRSVEGFTDQSGKSAFTDAALQLDTNQYIAQQVFNILTAQALTAEQTGNAKSKVVMEGFENGDVIHFDAADLSNSLNGPIVVAYSETSAGKSIDVADLVLRAISAPHRNHDTDAIEGISLLPLSPLEDYEASIANRGAGYKQLVDDIPLFKRANSVTTVISVPNKFNLTVSNRQQISNHVVNLFPNAKVRRYALVKGATSNIVSFTILISGSGALCDEALAHLTHYASSCFSSKAVDANEEVVDQIFEAIQNKPFSEESLTDLDKEVEDVSPVLAAYEGLGTWIGIKQPLEDTYRKIVGDERFMKIDKLMVTRKDVFDALRYLNVSFHYSVPKEIVRSLGRRPNAGQANAQTSSPNRVRSTKKDNS